MADISAHPLLKGNVITVSELNIYQELLKIETDPTHVLSVGDVRIEVSDATCKPCINVWLDGKQYLKDHLMLGTSLSFDFNVKLSRVSKPFLLQIKKTVAGAGDLIATVIVDGTEQY